MLDDEDQSFSSIQFLCFCRQYKLLNPILIWQFLQVEGLMKLMEGDHIGPFNLGNPGEFTMLELAKVVQDTIDPEARIEFRPNTADDPHKRKPDISRAKELLGWEPKVPLHEGLPLMVTDFRKRIFGDQEESTEAAGGLS